MIKTLLGKVWQSTSAMNDRLFRHGCDFAQWESCEALNFDESEGNKYMASGDMLKHVLKKIPISTQSKAIDIGCGKGKAMYIMSKYPFSVIKGIDISDKMVEIANDNFAKLGLQNRCGAIIADASEYKDYDEFSHFYMYNPVPEVVFKSVVKNIAESLERNPREAYILYLNPVHADIIESNVHFKKFYTKKGIYSWFDYYCYRYEK